MSGDKENKPLLKRILKAFGLFGSVESMLIVFSIVRTKLVAVLLGSTGIGLFGIFLQAIELIGTTTQLNINDSAVRSLAGSSDPKERSAIMTSISRWSWVLGATGAVVMLLAAPLFSYYTFGSGAWTWAYVSLSVVVMLNALTKGSTAIMRGIESFRNLAKAQVLGAACGLAVSVPLFYYLRLDSIIPSFIVYSFFTATIAIAVCKRATRSERVPVRSGFRESLGQGVSFIKLGAYMTVSTFATLASSYIFMAWLNDNADTSTVGHFNAGFTIVNRYVGIIFGAIAVEYFPRLSREISNGVPVSPSVETEINLGLSLLLPCVCLFMAVSPFVVELLYSSDFNVIVPFINWAMTGTLLRLFSWCIAFVILAKGDGRIYVVTEVVSAVVYVISSIMCYKYYGIVGLGYSYIIWYALYSVSVVLVYRFRYHFTLRSRVWMDLGLSLVVSALAISAVMCGYIWITVAFAAVTGFFALKKVRSAF